MWILLSSSMCRAWMCGHVLFSYMFGSFPHRSCMFLCVLLDRQRSLKRLDGVPGASHGGPTIKHATPSQGLRADPDSGASLPSSQGAHDSMMPSLADFRMDSGRGMECRTMAPYSPYSAMTLLRPQHFSRFLHFARLFWNQTCWNNSWG